VEQYPALLYVVSGWAGSKFELVSNETPLGPCSTPRSRKVEWPGDMQSVTM
jgi:hypothetical protein